VVSTPASECIEAKVCRSAYGVKTREVFARLQSH
jgi:hypothetical protein